MKSQAYQALGPNDQNTGVILKILKRKPNPNELAM